MPWPVPLRRGTCRSVAPVQPPSFCLFRSRRSQVVASTTLINHDLSVWLTKPAPSPPTVYWPNIRWRQWERSSRTLIVWVDFWALCFFYLIPIGAVQVCLACRVASSPDCAAARHCAASCSCAARSFSVAWLPCVHLRRVPCPCRPS
jgi:hypothetical protein